MSKYISSIRIDLKWPEYDFINSLENPDIHFMSFDSDFLNFSIAKFGENVFRAYVSIDSKIKGFKTFYSILNTEEKYRDNLKCVATEFLEANNGAELHVYLPDVIEGFEDMPPWVDLGQFFQLNKKESKQDE